MAAQRRELIRALGCAIVIVLLGSAIYSNTLSNPFVFDDLPFVLHNTRIRDLSDLGSIYHAMPQPSRFLSYLSFAWDYHWGKGDVRAFHVTNIIIHVINGILVLWLMMLTLRTYRFKDSEAARSQWLISLLCALLFLTHPIQTQAVTYITQRFASLATLFYVLCLCCYIVAKQKRKNSFYLLSAASAVAAMFTKEIALTLPVVIVLYDAVFFKRVKGKFPFHWIALFLLLLIIPAFYSFNVINILTMEAQSGSFMGEPIDRWVYFLTQSRVICRYLQLLFVPLGQNLLYEFQASRSLLEPATMLSFLGLTAILVFSFLIRKKNILVAFGMWWFFLALSVESSVLTIGHVIFEHRVYLPSVGFFMALTAGLWALIGKRWVATVVIAAAVAGNSYLTYHRNVVWQSAVTLWEDVVAKSPRLQKARLNLGVAYTDEGRFLDAIKVYDVMIAQQPSAEAFGNRGLVYDRMGASDLAISDYTKAIAILPRSARLLTGRGDAYFKKKDYTAALNDYTDAIKVNPEYYYAFSRRANTYRVLGKVALAQNDYNEALRLNPYLAEGYLGVGAVAFMQKDFAKAVDYFSHVLTLEKDSVQALLNRANAYSELARYDEAMADYARALTRDERNGQIYYNRAILYRKMGEPQKAEEDFKKAKALGYEP